MTLVSYRLTDVDECESEPYWHTLDLPILDRAVPNAAPPPRMLDAQNALRLEHSSGCLRDIISSTFPAEHLIQNF